MMVICGTCVAVLEAEGPFFIARRTKNAPTMYFFILTLVFVNTIIVYIRINREAGFWREGKSCGDYMGLFYFGHLKVWGSKNRILREYHCDFA